MMQQIGQKSTKIFSKSEIKIVKDEKNVDLATGIEKSKILYGKTLLDE